MASGVSWKLNDRRLHLIGAALGTLLSLWLLLPTLTPAHAEGFTAIIAALGLHLSHGTLAYFDQLEPLVTEYFGLTKLGMVMSIAGLTAILPVTAELAFRLLMWGGMLLFLVSSALLVRRWSGANWPAIVAPLVIMPGVFESGFVYSDNVLAAGLAACALCLLYARSIPVLALSGALFGCAVLTRTDTAFIALAFPIILVERFGVSRSAIVALGIAGAAGAIVLIGTLAWFNTTPWDIIRVGTAAVAAWDRPPSTGRSIAMLIFYLGLGGIGLAVLGAGAVLRTKTILPAIRLLLPPAIMLLVMRQSLWETRQFLVLTPFFATLVTLGLAAILAPVAGLGQRVLAATMIALVALSLFGPVAGRGFADGPRALTGRVWNIPAVLAWQAGSRSDVAALDDLVRRLRGLPHAALIANGWDETRYLQLSLVDRGYDLKPRTMLPGTCREAADHYERDGRSIDIVRNDHSFVPYAQRLAAKRFEERSIPCLRALGGAPQILVADISLVNKIPAAAFASPASDGTFDDPRVRNAMQNLTYRQLRDPGADRAAEAQLLAGYQRDTLDYRRRIGAAQDRKWSAATIADAQAATRARTRFAQNGTRP